MVSESPQEKGRRSWRKHDVKLESWSRCFRQATCGRAVCWLCCVFSVSGKELVRIQRASRTPPLVPVRVKNNARVTFPRFLSLGLAFIFCACMTTRYVGGQAGECSLEEGPLIGFRDRGEEEQVSFTCAKESFVTGLFLGLDSMGGVQGIRVECSTGEQSDWIGSGSSSCGFGFECGEYPCGWTQVLTSLEDSLRWPVSACVLEGGGYSDGEHPGPFG